MTTNINPTLTTFSSAIKTGTENSWSIMTFADLLAQGNEADSDGTVDGFVIKAVSSGTLMIDTFDPLYGLSFPTPWDAVTNNTIDATHKAYWMPDSGSTGTLNAFTAVAKDNLGAESATPIQATVQVNPNQAPTLTAFASAITTGAENTSVTISFMDLQAQGNEADVDGVVAGFVVKAVSSGTLTISSFDFGMMTWQTSPWDASTNNLINDYSKAIWTPDANSTGLLNAFTAVAKDDMGAESATPVQATVSVVASNIAPVLTAFSSAVQTAVENDWDTIINFADLLAQGDEADSDGTVDGFVIKAVSSGTLAIYVDFGIQVFWDAVANNTIDATHRAYWTPDANTTGTLNAFTAVAKDNLGAESATPIQAVIQVNPNQAPTLTTFSSAINTGAENTSVTINFADLQALGNEADVDGFVTAFVVKAVSSGTLTISTSDIFTNTWQTSLWDASSNNIIDAYHQAIWTPDANSTGLLNAFTAVAKDNLGAESATPIQATVNIGGNVNANAAPTNLAITANSINENVAANSVIGTLSSTDPDAGNSFTYSLAAGGVDNSAFTITGNQLKINSSPDFETKASYSVLVRTTDQGGLFFDKALTIGINNIVNETPILTTPTAISYTDTIFDDDFATATGTLTATNAMSYGITGGIDHGLTVSKTGLYGELTVTKADGSYQFVANDGAIEALTSAASISFEVSALNGLLSSKKTLVINIAQDGITESNLNNNLLGTSADDKFNGLAGNDKLDGGAGADTLIGGLGNDAYVVDNIGDVVTETSALATEVDSVESSISYTLGANLENLTLTGTAANGTGNTLNNVITGNAEANVLNGLEGADTLNGGAGADRLDGGTGADKLIGGLGNDTYVVDNIGDLVTESTLSTAEIDSVESSITYTLGANLENLTLTGTAAINGTGNALANVLTGNAAANTLNGLAGNDTLDGGEGNDKLDGGLGADSMTGGLGNDVYIVDNIGDVVIESTLSTAEIDRVESSISYTLGANLENLTLTGIGVINGTGNALDNTLTGNAAANTLDGGEGADSLAGGLGNDVYIVDNGGDVITENLTAGIDTVKSSVDYTLGANLENLTLTDTAVNGTGNTLNILHTD